MLVLVLNVEPCSVLDLSKITKREQVHASCWLSGEEKNSKFVISRVK